MSERSGNNPTHHPSFRFAVEIDNITEAAFSECSGLKVEVEMKEYREGGQNNFVHRLPGPVRYTNLSLKRGITYSKDFWQEWFKKISTGDFRECRRPLSIVLFDAGGNEVKRWNISNACPVRWSGPDFKADGNAVAIETLELVHDGFEEV